MPGMGWDLDRVAGFHRNVEHFVRLSWLIRRLRFVKNRMIYYHKLGASDPIQGRRFEGDVRILEVAFAQDHMIK